MSTTDLSPSLTATCRGVFVAVRERLGQFPMTLIQLAMRLSIAAVFFNSGLLKIRSWEFAIKLFEEEYKLPFLDPTLAARLAAFTELTFPVLIAVGLATRLATLPLLGMVAVIQIFVYPHAWHEHLLWASVLAVLLTRGPGAISVDHLVERNLAARWAGPHPTPDAAAPPNSRT